MKFTQSHFELIARAVADSRGDKDGAPAESTAFRYRQQADCTARSLADALATTNPRFDRAKFLRACGVQS